MGVSKLELMQGAVLAKICRNRRPVSLTLIESDDNNRSTYRINDVTIYIKYANSNRTTKNGTTWQFTFMERHIAEIHTYVARGVTKLCLVCVSDSETEIAFMSEEEIRRCLDLKNNQTQWMSVTAPPGSSLRVTGSYNSANEIIAYRNRIDKWEVPE